jgi:hypothetical protein
MTLKTKIVLGLAFLFFIIFSLVFVCSYNVGRLGDESTAILKDNYDSIVYARDMLGGLDDMKTSVINGLSHAGAAEGRSTYYDRLFNSGKKTFDMSLKAERGNITEIHEKEYVDVLNQEYDSYVKLCTQIRSGQDKGSTYLDTFLSASDRLRQSINAVYDVNMQAVVRKSQLVNRDSSRLVTSMAIIGTICIILALSYFWYFPVYISTTLTYLADRMRQLLKNNAIPLDDRTQDESLVILHGIELLEAKLGGAKPGSSGEQG